MVEARAFDFVIVGAGSAGCVLADRLSANGKYSVAVIEAGGSDRRFWVQMPLGYGRTFYDRSLNWAYGAEPDPGLAGRADYWPRGKLLGGSSSINAMVWIRGNALDFDDWARAGNDGWSYADCLPFFKSIEHNCAGADPWRGSGGPLNIADVSAYLHPLAQRFIAAGREAGLAFNPDFNGATQDGIGVYQITTRNGRRMSAAHAFLRPAMQRHNLHLITHAHVCRIVTAERRAVGVEFDQNGQRQTVRARREVILAAGAVNTPHILHLSGMGPPEHLASIGVEVVAASPATGHHLQDHLGINYIFHSKVPTLNNVLRPWWGKLAAGLDFGLRGRGPLTLSLNQGGGFIRTRPELDRPNVQLYFQAISTLNAKKGTRPLLMPDAFPGFSLGLSNCKPLSRGTILARSRDPFAAPQIIPNAFSAPSDLIDMLEGVQFLRKLAAQPALRDMVTGELAPGSGVVSNDDLLSDLRHRAATVYHPSGTCRMGLDAAQSSVDAHLRFRGIANLRVADASIFPSIISGNINAAVMMVAAKAAAIILADAR